MKKNSLPAERLVTLVTVSFLATLGPGCAMNLLSTKEVESPPEPHLVESKATADSKPTRTEPTPTLERQEEEIKKNKAVLEQQRQEIQRLKVQLGEY